jgi:hypothetical protein
MSRRRMLALIMVVSLLAAGAVDARTTSLPNGNVVKNAGGESPFGGDFTTRNIAPNGWEPADANDGKSVQVVRYGKDSRLLPPTLAAAIGGGKSFFVGGYPSRIAVAEQMVDVAKAAADVDAGGVKACLSGYLGGGRKTDSTARVDLAFLAEDGSSLGQLRIGPVTRGQRRDEGTLLRRATEKAVPSGTRRLRVDIVMQSGGGPSNYGFADNISVALTRGACDPVLSVRCVSKSLVATVTPAAIAKTQRVRFSVKGGSRTTQAADGRAPYTARISMAGLTGRLTVTAGVQQAGSGTIVLTKRSRHC